MNMSFTTLPANSIADIPAKTRTVPKSPLFQQMEGMKVGAGFIIDGASMEEVSANAYATAKRVGIRVTLRQLDDGVGVWRLRNPRTVATEEPEEEAVAVPRRGRPANKAANKTNKATKAGKVAKGRRAAA